MTSSSRIWIDPSTQLPSIQTFGELSQFLRDSMADDSSREFGQSMRALAGQIEVIVEHLKGSNSRAATAHLLMDLLTVLRKHRAQVVDLSPDWRGLYEYAAYLTALNNFRVLLGQWLLEGDPGDDEMPLSSDDFALVAWRLLGEGMLLIDMYEQLAVRHPDEQQSALGALEEPRVERAMAWWKKLGL